MKGWIGLVLLTLGVLISAAFGARNGDTHLEYRAANGRHASLSSLQADLGSGEAEAVKDAEAALKAWGVDPANIDSAVEDAAAKRDAIGLPPPRLRLLEWSSAAGWSWRGGIVLILVGAFLARRQQVEDNAGSGSAGDTARVDFPGTVTQVLDAIAELQAEIADLPMDDDGPRARETLDKLAVQTLQPLVEGRGQLIARHGLGGFAEYFGPWSSGERYLNRAWSALTDGHAVVARDALVRSVASFEQARKAYLDVEGRSA